MMVKYQGKRSESFKLKGKYFSVTIPFWRHHTSMPGNLKTYYKLLFSFTTSLLFLAFKSKHTNFKNNIFVNCIGLYTLVILSERSRRNS